jgi:hypothetical protein
LRFCSIGQVCTEIAHLIAWIHVHAAPEAVVNTAVFQVIARSRHGQSARVSQRVPSGDGGMRGGPRAFRGGKEGVTERGKACTHPFEAIVTIGPALLFIKRWKRRVAV